MYLVQKKQCCIKSHLLCCTWCKSYLLCRTRACAVPVRGECVVWWKIGGQQLNWVAPIGKPVHSVLVQLVGAKMYLLVQNTRYIRYICTVWHQLVTTPSCDRPNRSGVPHHHDALYPGKCASMCCGESVICKLWLKRQRAQAATRVSSRNGKYI